MESKIFFVAVVFLIGLTEIRGCGRTTFLLDCEGDDCDKPEGTGSWDCGLCGPPIDVTLRVRNAIVEPRFEDSHVMTGVNRRELLHHLLEAANAKEAFRFSMKHYGRELGVMVEGINGVDNEWFKRRTYWRILHANGTALDKGVSSFIPEHRNEIVFEYTRYTP